MTFYCFETFYFLYFHCSPYPNPTVHEQALLIDNNDTNVLDFEPNLKTLAILAVVENRIDTTWLPRELRLGKLKPVRINNLSTIFVLQIGNKSNDTTKFNKSTN